MRIAARDFATDPDDDAITGFETANGQALDRLAFIEKSLDETERMRLAWIPGRLKEIERRFSDVVARSAQHRLFRE